MSSISSALSTIFASPSLSAANNSSNGSSSSSSTSSGSSGSTSSDSSTGAPSSTFTGTSAYSSSLQSVINQAVAIADLPIELLSVQQTTLTSESTEMTNMNGLLANLQSAVQGVQQAMDGSSYSSDVTDSSGKESSAVTVTLGDSAQEGVYSMQVDSIGSYASGMTTSNWPAATGAASYKLVIGGKSDAITTTDKSAAGVAAAINQEYGDQVQATVVNVSSTDTRIALQSTSLSPQTLDLQNSSGTSLFTQSAGGTQAEYTVTGGSPVYTNSPSVVISPGITLTMQAVTSGPVNVTVSRSDSALSDALSAFATAYNAIADEITAQHGQNAGPLQGNPILQTIANTLNGIGTYGADANSTVSSVYNLGLELDASGDMNGHLTFTAMTLAGADIANSGDVDAFLGNSTTSGFLQYATNALTDLLDPTSGLLTTAQSDLKTQITDVGNTISTKQAQVTQLQTNLEAQMSQADALISETEQQFNYMNEMFQAEQTESQMYTGL
jgi:flagellar hook-associated protein 2